MAAFPSEYAMGLYEQGLITGAVVASQEVRRKEGR